MLIYPEVYKNRIFDDFKETRKSLLMHYKLIFQFIYYDFECGIETISYNIAKTNFMYIGCQGLEQLIIN